MNAVIYARYSSHNQTEQSIEGQLEVCKRYAENNNYNIIGEYIDRALTGTDDKRPQFLRMIKDSEKGLFNIVLVYQYDRFARGRYLSVKYKEILKQNNVKVVSANEVVTEDASGVIMESLYDGMAEYYSAELSQKTKRGLKISASKFQYLGGPIPLGYKVNKNKKFEIDENSVNIVKEIFQMYLEGSTMEIIANHINNLGYKTFYGKKFDKSKVGSILRNKKYIGTYTFKGLETPNAVPQIVDKEIFDKIQLKLNTNSSKNKCKREKSEYLLTTKLFCGNCKEMMTGICGTSRNKSSYGYYSCHGRKKGICKKSNIRKEYIEDLVVNYARKALTDKNIDIISKGVVKLSNERNNDNIIIEIKNEINNEEKQLSNLIESLKMCNEDTSRKLIIQEIENIQDNISKLNQEIIIEENKNIYITEEEIKFFLTKIREGDMNDIKYRKKIIDILVDKVYVYDDKITITMYVKNEHGINDTSINNIEGSFGSSSKNQGEPN